MSSGSATTLSPFVRGTTDANVFFLHAGLRRLVPDPSTLGFMSAGQPVRTLSDADLAVIPLGAPLPTRQDGTLVASKALTPGRIVYFMTGGLRRQVPDIETLTDMVKAGIAVLGLDPADLAAIPQGAMLPTRRDGTLYKGTGTTYAFVIQGGHKQAVPDATTLRDSGHDMTALLPASASDLALIPDGAPFPSTSRFLKPPAASIPLVLLPVRLETRFQHGELWLRIYPDDVHVNSFEPELTLDESTARANFLTQAQGGDDAARSAFRALAAQFGPQRAAWIASDNAQPGAKAAQWNQAPFTNILPERWIVIGYQGNALGQVLAVGPSISDSLAMGPDPNGTGPTSDEGIRWITDFARAIQVGMAFRITLKTEQQRGFNRIVVLGLRSDLDVQQSTQRLSDLLQAHHYTDGLELLPHNSPTNNTEDVKSRMTTRDPNYGTLYALEQGPPLCPARPTADGDRLARALGVPPALLAHVQGADGDLDEQATAMNAVLWPATWGYYLEQLVTGAVPNPGVILPAARDHFTAHVRARGHFPTVRIGRQPYGILPVCWSAQWKSLEGRPLDGPLMSLLSRMRATWENSVPNVPRIPGTQDPEAALVSLLGMTPSSQSYVTRSVIGPEYNLTYWSFVREDLPKTWWSTLTAKTLVDARDLSTLMANTRLANVSYLKTHRPLSDLMVAPAPLDGVPAPTYVAKLISLGWQALRDYPMPPPPVPLLLLLLRHAALRQYLDTALDLLTGARAAQPSEKLEPELVGISTVQPRPTSWDLLQRTLPGQGPVGAYLDGAKKNSTVPAFANFWNSFSSLTKLSAEALDFATREVLDLGSYRFDAWVTSLAHFRLDEARRVTPNGGIILGAYGWLEDVRPAATQMASAGYVHAPSLNHATTAAVLRSGYLSHRDGPQSPFQIDLSSDRVRLGLHLLDGIREGQPLGALLGYRLERTLHESQGNQLDQYIHVLRALASLQAVDTSGDGTSESVAANNVVDGLALLRKFHSDPQFWSTPGLPVPGLPPAGPIRDALTTAITRMDDALDAVADLGLAESVHQLLRGNTIRAGATLDAIARGDTLPPDIDVVQTPRASTGLTHRLLAIAVGDSAPGWTATPRAKAEPRLNAWMAKLLGDPTRVRARGNFVDASGAALQAIEITLDKLRLAPVDFLAFPENDGMSGELADRLRRAMTEARPSSVPSSATVQLVAERNSTWTADLISASEWLGLVKAVSRLVGGARPMEPGDLVVPGQSGGEIDTAELQARTDAAEAELRSVRAALQNSGGIEAALLSAARFGVTGAVPALDAAQWSAQATAAGNELDARIAKLDSLAAGLVRATATPDALLAQDVSRLQAVFGAAFVVLPIFAARLAATWPQLWTNSVPLQAGDAFASVRWFQRASRVRPGAARLDKALLYAEALSGTPLVHFDVAQLPSADGDRWLALDLSGNSPSSSLSLVAFSPTPYTPGAALAGLMVDEWVEVLPSANQITGISFHHDDPTARAPQAILLAVRHDDFPEWTMEAVEGSVLEALDLAKLRAVDPDTLGALGHYLPALYFAYNTGGGNVETVSADFSAAWKTAVTRSD
ncbi:MAG TPA: hypothetical protein VFK06_22080 [Candidatus Angelobacter sp.]|nr:hypothetical protein [Candidatus Angelobacter sp.]